MNLQDRLAGSTPPPPPPPPPPPESGYTVVALDLLPGGDTGIAYGINASGEVCGESNATDGFTHAVVWHGTTPTALDFLDGTEAHAYEINAAGLIAGKAKNAGVDNGVIWTGTSPGTPDGIALYGINDDGLACGLASGNVPCTWDGSTEVVLDSLASGTGIARGINAAGKVCGWSNDGIDDHAVTWVGTAVTQLDELGGDSNSFGRGINASQVVGRSLASGQAVVWDGTTPAALDTLDTGPNDWAFGINALGQICGQALLELPVVWNDGAITELPLLTGGTVGIANAINDSGVIVGSSDTAVTGDLPVMWVPDAAPTISGTGGAISAHAGIPKVHWTLDGTPIDLAGWNPNCNEGGYDQCRGQIPERQLMRLPWVGQGSTLTAQDSDGTIVWEGRMSSAPQVRNGIALLAAQGEKYAAVKKTDRLFIQSQDESLWTPTDSEPHLNSNGTAVYDHYRHIDVGGGKTRLMFKVDKDQALTSGSANGYVFYAEGVDLKRVAFWMNYDNSDETSNLLIRLQRAAGPRGAETNVNTWATTNGNNGDEKDETMGAVDDLVILELKVDSNFTPSSAGRYILSHVRVNSDIELTDTFHAYEIADYIGGVLNWDTGGVVASTFNSLPFDWDGDWASALDYLAENEDKMWRVTHDRNNLGPYLEYGDWGTTNWQVYTHDGADPDLTPQELYDKVIVWFTAPNGIKRRAVATTTANSSGNTFEYELADKQAEPTYAQLVADRLLRRYSVQRYQGVIPIVAAYDSRTGANAPYGILHGDTVTVADWRGGESQTLRVTDVEYGPAGVRVGVEQQINILSLLHKPRRKKKRHHGQHNG